MTLVNDGPDVLLVYPEVLGDDGYGTAVRVPSTTAVRVRGWMQPVSAEETATFGQEVGTLYRFLGTTIPGGAWAKVNWDGRDWDVVGEPTRRSYSPMTTFVSLLLKARSPRSL